MIVFPEHALERMEERGASRHEVRKAIREGEASDAPHGRTEFTYAFPFEDEWNGTYYDHKELTVYAADDGEIGSSSARFPATTDEDTAMRISVNRKLNVAYVHLQDEPDTVETKRLSEDLLMDVGPDGTVYGLELLNASEQIRSADLAELEVQDEESGETTRVSLPL